MVAEDADRTPLSISGEDVVFILGGAETSHEQRQIALAVVPPPGRKTFEGRAAGSVLSFYTVDCAQWTSLHHTMQVFGPDAVIFTQGSPGQSRQAIADDGSTMALAAQLKCNATPASVSGAVAQERLIDAENAIRTLTE